MTTLIEQARDLSGDVKAKKISRGEAVATLLVSWDLTERGAADVLDRWQELSRSSRNAEGSL